MLISLKGLAFGLTMMLSLTACGDGGGVDPDDDGPDRTVTSVEVQPAAATILDESSLQLTAVARNRSGEAVTGVSVQWTSSDPDVVAVDASGLTHGTDPGTATVTAAVGAVQGTAALTVEAPPVDAQVTLNPSVRFQTISGWQAGAQAAQELDSWPLFRDELLDRAVHELGMNRVRLGLVSGAENDRDYFAELKAGTLEYSEWRCRRYAPVNDNGDPSVIDPSGFHFTMLDLDVETAVLPLRDRLRAMGEDLYVNLTFLDHAPPGCGGENIHVADPNEYAELIVAAFIHLRDDYGLEVHGLELMNEPENNRFDGNRVMMGRAINAVMQRLRANGFDPDLVAPSAALARNVSAYLEAIGQTPGALAEIDELSYHRYDQPGEALLNSIRQRAAELGVRTGMGEWNGATVDQLLADLTVANVSAWEQGTLAWFNGPNWSDTGANHYWVDIGNPANPTVNIASRSRFLRQYFRFIRRGAQRIAATSTDAQLDPVAFIHPDDTWVTVIRSRRPGEIAVGGLPAGTYDVNYTTDAAFDVDADPVVIGDGEVLVTSLPAPGVISISGR